MRHRSAGRGALPAACLAYHQRSAPNKPTANSDTGIPTTVSRTNNGWLPDVHAGCVPTPQPLGFGTTNCGANVKTATTRPTRGSAGAAFHMPRVARRSSSHVWRGSGVVTAKAFALSPHFPAPGGRLRLGRGALLGDQFLHRKRQHVDQVLVDRI